MVAKGHKITNVPMFKKICDIMVLVPQKNHYVPHFLKQQDINSYNFLRDVHMVSEFEPVTAVSEARQA